jgi:hypothetical protein
MLQISNIFKKLCYNICMKIFIYTQFFLSTLFYVKAQTLFAEIDNLFKSSTNIVAGSLTTLLMGLAFAAFLFSIIRFIADRSKGDSDGLKDAKSRLVWTTVALFVMVAVWGLVNFLEISFLGKEIRTIAKPQTSWNTSSQNSSSPNSSGNSSKKIPKGGSCQILPGSNDNCASGLICITANDKVGEFGECTSLQ